MAIDSISVGSNWFSARRFLAEAQLEMQQPAVPSTTQEAAALILSE
jgi:hypothetical protein